MSPKWSFVFALALFAVVAVLPAQAQPVEGSVPQAPLLAGTCSGDDCGCGADTQACRAACPPEDNDCLRNCNRQGILCSKCCCCQCFQCSPGWGCFVQKDPVPPAADRMLFPDLGEPRPDACAEDAAGAGSASCPPSAADAGEPSTGTAEPAVAELFEE